ncbi:MAG: RidA family protein, partial [Sciscionella sp.]
MTELPQRSDVPVPQGRYLPAISHDGLVFSAGMTPRVGGQLRVRGIIGDGLEAHQARNAAGIAASNALLAVADAAGGLDRIDRCLRMTVYLACAADFTRHSEVADGASEALRAWLGDRGDVV